MSDALQPTILRGGRLAVSGWQAPRFCDIMIGSDGKIAAIGEALEGDACRIVTIEGRLVTPGLVDMHQHLDKSHSIDEAPNPSGTLAGASQAFGIYAEGLTSETIAARARRTAQACLERGTVAIRSHANVDHQLRLRSVAALLALRRELAGRLHIDVVAFVTGSAAKGDLAEAESLLEQAIGLGAGIVGGAPNLAPDPKAFIDMLLRVATRHDLPVDLHIDETMNPQARALDYLAQEVARLGFRQRVVAGHCSSLAAMDAASAAAIMEKVKAAGIGVVTLPSANLFLQGRDGAPPSPRGLTRIGALVERGIPVATASDNIQDAFVPVGSGDLLELARWTILAGHLLKDAPALAFDMITHTPAQLMDLPSAGLSPGDWANLLVTDATDIADLVRSGPLARTVYYRGRHVAGPQCESYAATPGVATPKPVCAP